MSEINDIDFEEDQQQLIEKTDIQTLASYCNELADIENNIDNLEKQLKKQKEQALEDFKTGKATVLCSTKALNQGLDIPDANMGVICGLTSKSLSMIQRVGRLIRFQEGKTGEIYILYVENSQEEKWLKTAVKSLNNVNWLP